MDNDTLRFHLRDIEQKLDDSCKTVETIRFFLAGNGGDGGGEGIGTDLRLRWVHENLRQAKSTLGEIQFTVWVVAVASIAHVWHHW